MAYLSIKRLTKWLVFGLYEGFVDAELSFNSYCKGFSPR